MLLRLIQFFAYDADGIARVQPLFAEHVNIIVC
jgi:hypothetical protein